jgi:hypothetical protein
LAQFRKLALLEAGRCSTRWARGGARTDIARGWSSIASVVSIDWSRFTKATAYVSIFYSVVMFGARKQSEFIYFQF